MILPGGLISLHSVNAIILPRSVEGIMFRTISAELSVSDSRLSIKSKYIHSITPSSFMPFQIPRFLIKSQILTDEHKYGDIQSPQIITNYLKKKRLSAMSGFLQKTRFVICTTLLQGKGTNLLQLQRGHLLFCGGPTFFVIHPVEQSAQP